MPEKYYLIFPLTSAVLYALGALVLKGAERRGVSVWQITALANVALAAAFAGFYPWADFPALPAVWWPVAAVGGLLVAGQAMSILAFARGEVSVATPALGTKVVFVAVVASVFVDRPVAPQTWAAAVLMLAGLWLVVGRPAKVDGRRIAAAVVFSLLGALGFACFDLVVQVWSPALGLGVLVPMGIATGAVLSLPLLWLHPSGSSAVHVPRTAAGPMALGVALLTLQSLLLIWSIGHFEDAAGANVVYASRGVWGVLLVQLLPGWFGRVERFESRAVFVRRALGAGVMMIGVFLAFAGPPAPGRAHEGSAASRLPAAAGPIGGQ